MNTKKRTPFHDGSLPIEKRLDWLLEAMTIEEKLGCLSSSAPAIERLGIQAMSVGGEAAHGVEARNDQNSLGAAEVTTSFVQPIGMSATWDPELIEQAGAVTGTEARVIYHRHPDRGLSRWAPTVDLERDPRWGRTEEGYGEDPVLTGEMASAYIRGMQGDHPQYLRTAATLKHFYANNTEEGRGWKSSTIDPRNRYELYLEPFRRAIEKGHAEGVMTAYNKINGVPGMLNHEVQDILKNQYGLKHAVSDGGAMGLVKSFHHYYGTDAETLAASLKAGVDAMSDNPKDVHRAAVEAWEAGLITEEDVNRALRNMFRTKLRLGIYDDVNQNPYDKVTEDDLDSAANRAVCAEVSREAVVLLKNENDFLPLDASDDDIALIGPMADAWFADWYGGHPPFRTTLKEGIAGILGRELPWTDGQDRVVFWYGEKAIAIREDGSLGLAGKPDVFVKEEWGEGSVTFRSVRTGKYMNTRLYQSGTDAEMPGKIAAEKDDTLDWFVMELFHIEEQADGSVILTNRFESPVQVDEDGSLWSMREGEGARFRMEKTEDGIASACAFARSRKRVILALGCNSMINAKEEIDRSTIQLPPAQEKLMEAVCRENPNTVLVLFSNYPYALTNAQEKIPAILWSATGAQDMGAAMAAAVFGRSNPAGRLNMTWYREDGQLPDIDDYDVICGGRTYRYFEGDALYPFGYGLSYTTFSYANLSVQVKEDAKLQVCFTVTNTGRRTGDEVAQVYGCAPSSRVKKPLRQLLGFRRLHDVKPGETRQVELTIPVEEFCFYDVISKRLIVEQGKYTIFAGRSCVDRAVEKTVEIPGVCTGLRDAFGRVRADHYDAYENIILTEGHFGYTAAAVKHDKTEGMLYYRDCILDVPDPLPDEETAGIKRTPEPKPGEAPIQENGKEAAAVPLKMVLRAFSEEKGGITVLVNGKKAAVWQGNTRLYEEVPRIALDRRSKEDERARKATWRPVFTDVVLKLETDELEWRRPAEIALCLQGDVKVCWWQVQR